jgi:hypothetical protein
MTRDEDTTRLADRQQGLLTTDQALELGWSGSAIDRAVQGGRIERPEPGVLRIGGAPPTWKQRVLARCLAESGFASHRTAAALWRLEGFDPRIIEITTHRWKRRPNESVKIHENLRMTAADVTTIEGIPCTSVEWTLIHLGAVVPAVLVEQALDDALRRNLTTPEKLWQVFQRVAGKGVRGVGVIRPMLVRRLGTSGRRPNGFEKKLFRILKRAGLPLPEPQWEIRDGDWVAFADWGWAHRRVALECVSDEWHSGRVRRHRDTTRRNRITNLGILVVEFTHDHVTDEKEYVAQECSRAYELGGRVLA